MTKINESQISPELLAPLLSPITKSLQDYKKEAPWHDVAFERGLVNPHIEGFPNGLLELNPISLIDKMHRAWEIIHPTPVTLAEGLHLLRQQILTCSGWRLPSATEFQQLFFYNEPKKRIPRLTAPRWRDTPCFLCSDVVMPPNNECYVYIPDLNAGFRVGHNEPFTLAVVRDFSQRDFSNLLAYRPGQSEPPPKPNTDLAFNLGYALGEHVSQLDSEAQQDWTERVIDGEIEMDDLQKLKEHHGNAYLKEYSAIAADYRIGYKIGLGTTDDDIII